MIGALDHGVAAIQKPVLLPVQGYIQVWAAIVVEVNLALLFDRKQLAPSQIKTLTATFGNVGNRAKAQLIL